MPIEYYLEQYPWAIVLSVVVVVLFLLRLIFAPIYEAYLKMKLWRSEKIIDEWGTIIAGAKDRQEQLYEKVEKYLTHHQPPEVEWKIAPFRGLGFSLETRDYLHIRSKSKRMKEFLVYVGARPYGNDLDIAWYATIRPSSFKRFIAWRFQTEIAATLSLCLNLFESQDLRAYVTVVHHCVKQAMQEIMEEVGQDPSGLKDAKSKGFLEVW